MVDKLGFKTFYIFSVGCKTNQCESDEISSRLAGKGYSPVKITGNPGIIIINTCTVTSAAAKKVRQYLRRARAINPYSKIIITGCHAVFNSEELKNLGADLIVQNKEKEKIPEIIEPGNNNEPSINLLHAGPVSTHSRALIKIQDGCQQRCSYCIVPFVRGKYRSAGPDEVINRARFFNSCGYDEVVFTGIHIGKYGIDLTALSDNHEYAGSSVKNTPVLNLAALLRKTLENTTVKRIRLSSIEVNEIDRDLIDVIKFPGGRIAPHLHIPLQSGSERILKAMNRQYSCRFFLETVKKLKKEIPGIVLTTDIIIGFPSETDDDFNDTLNAIKEADFKKTHVFKYSRRALTAAYAMDLQVDEKVKSARSRIAREIAEKIRDKYIESNIKSRLKVVCETYDSITGTAGGTSENYLKVYFGMSASEFNRKKCRIIDIDINRKFKNGLYGTYMPG